MRYEHKNGVILRKVCRGDLEQLLELKAESWPGTHRIAIINKEDQERWYDRVSRAADTLALFAEYRDLPLGIFIYQDIDWPSQNYTSSHSVFRMRRGQGLGLLLRAAGVDFGFEILNMHRVNSEILVTNIPSQKTAVALGFQPEGVKRQAIQRCGKLIDSQVWGLLREEWLASERVQAYGGVCNLNYRMPAALP